MPTSPRLGAHGDNVMSGDQYVACLPASLFSFCLLQCRDPFFLHSLPRGVWQTPAVPTYVSPSTVTQLLSDMSLVCEAYLSLKSIPAAMQHVKTNVKDILWACHVFVFTSSVWIMIWLGKLSSLGLIIMLHGVYVTAFRPISKLKMCFATQWKRLAHSLTLFTELSRKSNRIMLKSSFSNIWITEFMVKDFQFFNLCASSCDGYVIQFWISNDVILEPHSVMNLSLCQTHWLYKIWT